jgi:TRAP transporter 4TM/12TM fusion protein
MVSFFLFAQLLVVTGAGQWFIDVAQALLGHVRGGSAKVAVVASSLMGTISGSSVANIAAVGVFTIPLMKATGYRSTFAGGVEAAASNGGQIMPPVMGIAAFMMIDFLQRPYNRIILAGILPALAYYFALYLMVDFEAAKTGLRGIPRSQLPPLKETLIDGWQYILPLATLVFLLIALSYSAELSALYASAVMVVIGVFNKKNRLTLNKIYLVLKDTAIAMMLVAITLATASIIVGCVQLTGLSYRLSMGLVGVAGGNVWLLLVLTAVACIILGMGMTTSAVYVIMATLVAPALVSVGFIPLAAHFFVFYFGVAALITPPVCPASFVAAGIAGSPPMSTGLTATRLAIITFLAPFIFVFEPAFLWEGSAMQIVLVSLRIMLATVVLAGGLAGYMFGNLNYWWRILFIGLALVIVYPAPLTNVAGSIVAVVALLVKFLLSRFSRRPGAVAASGSS